MPSRICDGVVAEASWAETGWLYAVSGGGGGIESCARSTGFIACLGDGEGERLGGGLDGGEAPPPPPPPPPPFTPAAARRAARAASDAASAGESGESGESGSSARGGGDIASGGDASPPPMACVRTFSLGKTPEEACPEAASSGASGRSGGSPDR